MLFNPGSIISPTHPARRRDVRSLKNALSLATDFRPSPGTDSGMTDEAMFDAVRRFQRDNGLRVDGEVRPGGSTQRMLNDRLADITRSSTQTRSSGATRTSLPQTNASAGAGATTSRTPQSGGGFLKRLLDNATFAFGETRTANSSEPSFRNLAGPPDDGSRPLPPDDGGESPEGEAPPDGDGGDNPEDGGEEEEKPDEDEMQPEEEECPLELIQLGNQYRRELDKALAERRNVERRIGQVRTEIDSFEAEIARKEFEVRLEGLRTVQRGRLPRPRSSLELARLRSQLRSLEETLSRLLTDLETIQTEVNEARERLQDVFEEASKYARCDGLIGLPSE